jgi:hypothetical protein
MYPLSKVGVNFQIDPLPKKRLATDEFFSALLGLP